MTRKLIQKIIGELSKDNPKLDYVRGILETVLESLPEEKVQTPIIGNLSHVPVINTPASVNAEVAALDAFAKGSLETIKALAQSSTETI